MAPEQFGPERWATGAVELSAASDLFAAAATFVHVAGGAAPFAPPGGGKLTVDACLRAAPLRAPEAMRRLVQRLADAEARADAARGAALQAEAEAVLRALRSEAGKRFASAQEMLDALDGKA
jgi:hypothetical protein